MVNKNPILEVFSDKDFDEIFDDTLKASIKSFDGLEGKSGFQPRLYIAYTEKDDGKVLGDVVLFASFDENRFKIMEELGKTYAKQNKYVWAVFLSSEIWWKRYNTSTPDKLPSESPDRQEALMVAGQTIDKRMKMSLMQIKNRMIGSPISPEHYKEMKSDILDSFFKGYLWEFAGGKK